MGTPLDHLNPKQRAMVEAALNGVAVARKRGDLSPEDQIRSRERLLEAGLKTQGNGTGGAPLVLDRGSVLLASLPIKTVSEANQREHWSVKAKRVKGQRADVARFLGSALTPARGRPEHVFLVRRGSRNLDSDNAWISMKGVRDEIASLLGFDDKDAAVQWHVSQLQESKGASVFVVIKW